jgi:uncharacterized Zn finger protein
MSVFDTMNEYTSWPPSQYQEPRAVADGIQFNTDITGLAGTWWSKRWFSIIDEFGLGIRWERAKFYASRGQVKSIEIENGLVKASVQGSAAEPYRVMISIKTIAKPVWTAILQDLGKTSSFAIGLASGTLPSEENVSRVFSENGVLLFPDRQGELHTKCTCLDWSNPCKHIAAVYLLLGAEFDRDPFLLFKLRGLEQQEFFKLTSAGRGGSKSSGEEMRDQDPPATDELPTAPQAVAGLLDFCPPEISCAVGEGERDADVPRQSEDTGLRQFWKTPLLSDATVSGRWGHSQVAAQTASLAASLGEFPFWQGSDGFFERIRCAYESAPEHAETILLKRIRF